MGFDDEPMLNTYPLKVGALIVIILGILLFLSVGVFHYYERERYRPFCTNDVRERYLSQCTDKTDCVNKCMDRMYANKGVT